MGRCLVRLCVGLCGVVLLGCVDEGTGPAGSLQSTTAAAASCHPSCNKKECGWDGCGGSCGTCAAGLVCNAGICGPCVPDCAGRVCGPDGCGGSCGSCPAGQACSTTFGLCESGGGWTVAYQEDFETTALPAPAWAADTYPNDGPFSDDGVFFHNTIPGFAPPVAYRASAAFGTAGWLTAESYTRDAATTPFGALLEVVPDPAGGPNKVLKLRSPAHTDATVIRSTQPLPERYRISLRVGYPSFGSGSSKDHNGYDSGGERALPWSEDWSAAENGFYYLAILDSVPRPHNNIWIHHHRKVCMDSDNHYPPWLKIWNGKRFVRSGVHPVMMFAVDGRSPGWVTSGKDFISYAAGAWQQYTQVGEIRAADAYTDLTWYDVTIERSHDKYTLEIAGTFQYGGPTRYRGSIDYKQNCVWHYNQTPTDMDPACEDLTFWDEIGSAFPNWPLGQSYPDYFMFGDPHNNYYEGFVYYDDVKLEVWQP
jgi:hypothetical protein